jgi:hypothetical protein
MATNGRPRPATGHVRPVSSHQTAAILVLVTTTACELVREGSKRFTWAVGYNRECDQDETMTLRNAPESRGIPRNADSPVSRESGSEWEEPGT